jgi:hypothetical protein
MAILNNSNAISSGGYDINNSVRLRSSASAYLSRTPASSGNRQKWTYSIWLKKGSIGTEQAIWQAGTAANGDSRFYFATSGAITWEVYNGSTGAGSATTSALYRDFSAWYHVVISVDTTQATSSNRIKLYVNGEQVTSFSSSSYPAQNDNLDGFNLSSATHYIGSNKGSGRFYDGYMTDINFVDGSQLTPSDFGETDSTTGVWKPKAYTGTYGTNGFYLKFSDIATTSGSNAGLGKDFSGNANYWTTNNISVTAGTTYDAMIDSPTLTSATVANYAVMNPLVRLYGTATLSDANLKINDTSTGGGAGYATIAVTSGKFYYEFTPSAVGKTSGMGVTFASVYSFGYDGCYLNNGSVSNTTGGSAATYASYTTNDVIGVAFDADAGKVWFYKNGTIQAGDPVAGTGQAFTWAANSLVTATYAMDNSAGTVGINANFGQRPFAYTPPTGFVRLNTYNLPDSTIKKGNTVMDATLYTGNGSTQTVTNAAGFKPDWVWLKERSSTSSNNVYDSIRGTTKYLLTNATDAEGTDATSLTAFNSNGFSLGGAGFTNENAQTYVAWQWQAGQGSTSSNTSGSITSTVSVSTTAGFSIVTYTGTGANATVGHGLGVAPKMIITRYRGSESWSVYHTSLGGTKTLYLNLTNAANTTSLAWNNTDPTSTVFSLGSAGTTNTSGGSGMVAYCWAEIAGFSKFGSYTGNGSADGPFVYTGFRPKWIMIKQTTASPAATDWYIVDATRNDANLTNKILYANLSNAEATGANAVLDIVSNGFKIRGSDGTVNYSSSPYIYMVFAQNPFKNALAR